MDIMDGDATNMHERMAGMTQEEMAMTFTCRLFELFFGLDYNPLSVTPYWCHSGSFMSCTKLNKSSKNK